VKYEKEFQRLISDDLNLPGAVALLWNLVKEPNKSFPTSKKMVTLLKMDRVLGLKVEHLETPREVRDLIEERDRLRDEKDWVASDEIRDKVEQMGYRAEDTEGGTVVKKIQDTG
jgi:cysteinyl-tRNA synthetase